MDSLVEHLPALQDQPAMFSLMFVGARSRLKSVPKRPPRPR